MNQKHFIFVQSSHIGENLQNVQEVMLKKHHKNYEQDNAIHIW